MAGALRRLWARYWLRNVKFTGRYGDLQKLYAVRDPWNLAHPAEQDRFAATNAHLHRLLPRCESLLELGCGEGLQTAWFAKVSRKVAGLDVSPLAVQRARILCSDADLRTGPAERLDQLFAGRRFDVVTACEVLYYAPDAKDVLAAARNVTDCILVTNLSARAERLREHLTGAGWTRLDDIVIGDLTWRCDVWRRASEERQA